MDLDNTRFVVGSKWLEIISYRRVNFRRLVWYVCMYMYVLLSDAMPEHLEIDYRVRLCASASDRTDR